MTVAGDSHSPPILLADDDRSMRSLLCLAMEEEGYTVVATKNGEQCLAEFKRLQPDMVLLDAVMPVMDGFTCCRQLRTLPGGEHTAVLMITVLDDADSVDRAFAAGATDYVTKPIHWAVLRQRVSRLLQAARALKQVTQVTQALQKQSQRERLFANLAQRLAHSLTLEEMLSPAIADLRQFLNVQGIGLYCQNGQCFLESVANGATAMAKPALEMAGETLLQQESAIAIADLSVAEIDRQTFSDFAPLNAKAVLTMPLSIREQRWGVLSAYHPECRQWEPAEVELVRELANLMALAIATAS